MVEICQVIIPILTMNLKHYINLHTTQITSCKCYAKFYGIHSLIITRFNGLETDDKKLKNMYTEE